MDNANGIFPICGQNSDSTTLLNVLAAGQMVSNHSIAIQTDEDASLSYIQYGWINESASQQIDINDAWLTLQDRADAIAGDVTNVAFGT